MCETRSYWSSRLIRTSAMTTAPALISTTATNRTHCCGVSQVWFQMPDSTDKAMAAAANHAVARVESTAQAASGASGSSGSGTTLAGATMLKRVRTTSQPMAIPAPSRAALSLLTNPPSDFDLLSLGNATPPASPGQGVQDAKRPHPEPGRILYENALVPRR